MRAFGDISSLAAIAAPQTKYPQNIQNVAASVLVTSVSALERNNGVLCLLGGTHVRLSYVPTVRFMFHSCTSTQTELWLCSLYNAGAIKYLKC